MDAPAFASPARAALGALRCRGEPRVHQGARSRPASKGAPGGRRECINAGPRSGPPAAGQGPSGMASTTAGSNASATALKRLSAPPRGTSTAWGAAALHPSTRGTPTDAWGAAAPHMAADGRIFAFTASAGLAAGALGASTAAWGAAAPHMAAAGRIFAFTASAGLAAGALTAAPTGGRGTERSWLGRRTPSGPTVCLDTAGTGT
jgi:hypothetical protein